ncbi:MAG: sulfoxide reductase heme-binding subunit YedZ [Rhodospirillum sp.]|nr:sulfoxide reductase heme-binding subunit YedZ [Rhodospirillum sp.]MCF8489314.1 sulfoxide reductase heme-binding subunit YedZ [Rhodospirillum sp.]MCF8500258.1 sulfoxide reductase heme-binding subunit YedZ [Rhodospirillum sp.]
MIRFTSSSIDREVLARVGTVLLCGAPLVWQVVLLFSGGLGANPIEALTRNLGEWGLILLLVGLSLSPLRRAFGWTMALRRRRMVGLFAFFYICLHLLSYVGLDQFFHWPTIWADIIKRIYITVGFGAFLLLVPLAVTSTHRWVKRLTYRRWKVLHRLVYPAALLGVVHYWLMVKADITEPVIFAGILAALLGTRLLPKGSLEHWLSNRTTGAGARVSRRSRPLNRPGSA